MQGALQENTLVADRAQILIAVDGVFLGAWEVFIA